MTALEAAGGLRWVADPTTRTGRIAWESPDWLGPIRIAKESAALSGVEDLWPETRRSGADDLGTFEALETPDEAASHTGLRLSVRAYRERSVLVFRIEALRDHEGLATGEYDDPSIAWPAVRADLRQDAGVSDGTSAFGHLFAEFAIPTFSDASLAGFFLLPFRPAVVSPLSLVAPDGRTLLLAPLDHFHDQVIAVPRGPTQHERGVRAGWQGDLEHVPRGFATELAVWAAAAPRKALEEWGHFLRMRHGTRRLSRYSDPAVGRLSYWTDNGAAYWYRTHADLDMTATLEQAVACVEAAAPVGAVELDSWFYPHHVLRRVGADGPDEVPPTGALRWEPREDVFPDGITRLRERIGGKPLILHARHLSSESPYTEAFPCWVDGDRAHPQGPEYFDTLLRQAADWGAIQVEQDWLVECFLGVRALRAEPGRAACWQGDLDRAAAAHGLHLVWCMATPADFLETVKLGRIAAIRTSGDYRYGLSSQSLWCWFLLVNAFARALGLLPFKDVFLSSAQGEGLDGDPLADVEAMLSALSAGPVGLGDRIGRTDAERVRRTCRADGVLVKPDLPIAALDRCFLAHPHTTATPLLGETVSHHPAGIWTYLVLLHGWREDRPIEFEFDVAELREHAPTGDFVVYDWRSGTVETDPARVWSLTLAPEEWQLRLLCPLLPGDCTLIGDPTLYASMGDRRLSRVRPNGRDGLTFEVQGASGERVKIRGYRAAPPEKATAWEPTGRRPLPLAHDAASGLFDIEVEIGERGWVQIDVT